MVAVVASLAVLAGLLSWGRLLPGRSLNGGLPAPAGTVAASEAAATGTPLLRLAVAGDVGTADEQERATATAMTRRGGARGWDGLLLLGDNIYDDGNPDRAGSAVLQPFADVLRDGTPLLAALGNHDADSGYGPAQLTALRQPGSRFSQQIGPVKVVVLDSNRPENREQLAFLERALSRTKSRWTIVAMHHPMFSAGYHGSSLTVRNAFLPLIRKYHVQLVLAGHDHDYQRNRQLGERPSSCPAQRRSCAPPATTATLSCRSPVGTSWTSRFTATMVLRAVDQQGQVFDGATLR